MAPPGADDATAAKEPLLLPYPPPPCYGVPVGGYEAPPAQPYLLIPVRPRRRRARWGALLSSSLLVLLAAAILLGAAGYFLWPSVPDAHLSWLDLFAIRASAYRHGGVRLDVDVGLGARVHNPNLYSLRYDGVTVELGYRGRRLGTVGMGGARLRARGESEVEARLRVEDVWVLEDTARLIEDMARGRIPLDAVTRVKGRFQLLGWAIPMRGRISCAINVDVENQIIASQDCYPEQQKDLRILAERTSRDSTALWVSPSSSAKPSPKGTSYSLT